jgi:16S rRNA (adenine1518-N6/adenine1519-N6)-dimethyltransferase
MPPKSKLGQNFLNDSAAIQRIAAALGDLSGRTVIEIGPGRGAITAALVARAAHVVAVEVDPALAAGLRTEFPGERLTVVEQDVLQFDLKAAAERYGNPAAGVGERLLVVGNLPYYITSPILHKLAENHAVLDRAVLMVQREVADRVTADPHSREYGLLSITVQMFGPTQAIFTLPPSAFSPPPEVHSTVFRWRFAPRFTELGVEEASFLRLLRQMFSQKRKTLGNNLRAASLPTETIAAALDAAQIPAQARAEELSMETIAALWKALQPKAVE